MNLHRYLSSAVLSSIPVLGVLEIWEPYFHNLTLALSAFVFVGALGLTLEKDPKPSPGVVRWFGLLTILIPAVALLAHGWRWCGGVFLYFAVAADARRDRLMAKQKESEVKA